MRAFGLTLCLFALIGFVLPSVTAQNKDDEKKADKKDAEKKDAKDEKKAADKKGDEKKSDKDDVPKTPMGKKKTGDPEEEKILTGTFTLTALIRQLDGNSSGEFTVELRQPWQPKVKANYAWYKSLVDAKAVTAETAKQYDQRMRESNIVEVRTGPSMKVRSLSPPLEFDSKGNVKRWTAKEIAAARAGSKLPGLPAQFDALKTGQIVELYIDKIPVKKTAAAAKDKKKKNIDDEPDDPLLKPELRMIVILREPLPR